MYLSESFSLLIELLLELDVLPTSLLEVLLELDVLPTSLLEVLLELEVLSASLLEVLIDSLVGGSYRSFFVHGSSSSSGRWSRERLRMGCSVGMGGTCGGFMAS